MNVNVNVNKDQEYLASNDMVVLDAASVRGKVRVVRRGKGKEKGRGDVPATADQRERQVDDEGEEEEGDAKSPVVGWWREHFDVHSGLRWGGT